DFVSQALFAFRDWGPEVLVENLYILDQSFATILDPTNDLFRREFAFDDDGKIPLNRRKTWKRTSRYSSRSILKQPLEVKFEKQENRQPKRVGNIGMDLPEHAKFFVAVYQSRGPAGMEERARFPGPGDGVANPLQIQNPLHQSFAIQETKRDRGARAQASRRSRAVEDPAQALPLLSGSVAPQ